MPNPVNLASFEKISGAAGIITAPGSRSPERAQDRPDCQLVETDKDANEPNHHSTVLNRPARSANLRHSTCKSAKPAPAAAGRATNTSQCSARNRGRSRRTISRSRRRTRVRWTALPTRRDVMMPRRTSGPASDFKQLKVTNFPCIDRPSRRRRANSPAWLSRADLGKANERAGIERERMGSSPLQRSSSTHDLSCRRSPTRKPTSGGSAACNESRRLWATGACDRRDGAGTE